MPTLFDLLEQHKKHPKEKRVFGLVVQGGGMRAAYSAGAIVPLIEYGFEDTFDHVVGSSAGGINGAYFVDRHPETMDTYMNELTSKNFVNLLRREKMVDVDYAIDVILKQKHPISAANLAKAHTKIHIVVTDAKTGKKVVISDHHKFAQIYEELRATSALPLLYDRPVLLDGKYYIDGSVADSIPIDVAMKLGCTDIVVIMNTQTKSYRFDRRHERLVKHLIRRFAKKYNAAVRRKLPTDERLLQVNLRRLTRPHKKVRVYLLEPSDEEVLISMGTIDKPKVRTLAKLGVTDMDSFLHKPIIKT
jgi:predicted patatin/cPLA2 family phospholipase